MTKNDLIQNLGRIAKSGTRDFQQFLKSGDANLIGQFGFGFYSAFLVAEKVTVITKHNRDPTQWIWQSSVSSQFTIVPDPRGNTLGRGTQIILHLKESGYQYLDRDTLVSLIRHYSMFVEYPVKIWHFHDVYVRETEIEENSVDDFLDDDIDQEVVESDDDSSTSSDEKPSPDPNNEEKTGMKKTIWQWERVNNNKPLWMRDPETIPQADYTAFYQAYFKDGDVPLRYVHFKGEGRFSFHALLFIPSRNSKESFRNIRLYVKRILVSDQWGDELLPDYFDFVKGIIDSNDLELNVDRDHLAKTNTLKLIKKKNNIKINWCFPASFSV